VTSEQVTRWGGLALLLGGVAGLLFSLLLAPSGGVTGAHRAHGATWMPAHSMHTVSAVLLLFGVIGLYWRLAPTSGRLGLAGFVCALVGTALFVATGVVTAYVFPAVASAAPSAVEPGGALLSGPVLGVFGLTALLLSVGYAILGVAALRHGSLPRGGALLFVAGALVLAMPVEPFGPLPWAGLIAGGVLTTLGQTWLGYALAAAR
jgi:hypothetical protein